MFEECNCQHAKFLVCTPMILQFYTVVFPVEHYVTLYDSMYTACFKETKSPSVSQYIMTPVKGLITQLGVFFVVGPLYHIEWNQLQAIWPWPHQRYICEVACRHQPWFRDCQQWQYVWPGNCYTVICRIYLIVRYLFCRGLVNVLKLINNSLLLWHIQCFLNFDNVAFFSSKIDLDESKTVSID